MHYAISNKAMRGQHALSRPAGKRTAFACGRPAPAIIFVFILALALVSAGAIDIAPADAASPELAARQVGHLRTASVPANCKEKASTITLFRFGWQAGANHLATSARKTRYDVTGDAKADVVSVKVTSAGAAGALASRLQVRVNGTLACSISARHQDIDQASVSIVTLKNNKPFLFVSTLSASRGAEQGLYAWSDGRFEKVVGNDLLSRQGTSNSFISAVTPTGNRVLVQFEFVSSVTGHTRTSFPYVWKGGKLVRSGDMTSALRFATTSNGSFTATSTGEYAKQARGISQKITAFTSPSLKGRSFTVPAGNKVRPIALRLRDDALLYRIQYGSKRGWIRCEAAKSYKGGRLLEGTYGKIPLSPRPLVYSKTRKLSVSALEKLDNHALYLARNEVFARHGLAFSTAELKSYFRAKKWYKPKANARIDLSKVETRNVELMLAIEKNRNSPYVL